MPVLISNMNSFAGGITPVNGVAKKFKVTLSGTWATGDWVTLAMLPSTTGVAATVGAGAATGLAPTFALTLSRKAYYACGTSMVFSALAQPTVLNDPNAIGNSYIIPADNYGTAESIMALATYQGRLAVFERGNVQIWAQGASPAEDYQQLQILANVGAVAPLSVQAVGNLDVLFLADSGVRSLRVRDSSNNAIVVDVGTPVDGAITAHLAALTEEEKAGICGIVEPGTGAYWLYLPTASGDATEYPGCIYVLSYYPTAEVSAWGTFWPTYAADGENVAFAPLKFVVANGQVFARAADGMYSYGGATGNEFDACGVAWETPWLDNGQPATRKRVQAVDAGCEGHWVLSLGMDPVSGTLATCYEHSSSSFGLGRMGVRAMGYHVKLRGVESGDGDARFSLAALHFEGSEAS